MTPASLDFFMTEIEKFKASLEKLAGTSLSNEGLQEAVRLHNENRRLLREIYDFRKEIPPLLSGVEAMEIILPSLSVPVIGGNRWLKEVIQEVRTRPRLPPEKVKPRILVYGSEIDNIALVDLVEQCGADVVMDDLCLGTRHFWHDADLTQNPLEGIAVRYLDKILCPRTFREGSPQDRFGYLQDYLTNFEARGVLLYVLRFCDTHGYDAVDVKDFLNQMGVPVLWLDSDYTLGQTGADDTGYR